MVELYTLYSLYPKYLEPLTEDDAPEPGPSTLTQTDRFVRVMQSGRIGYYGLYIDRNGILAQTQALDESLLYLIDYADWLGADTISSQTLTSDTGVTVSVAQSNTTQVQIRVANITWDSNVMVRITTAAGNIYELPIRFYFED